jgi:hypothetical protein
LTLVSIWAAGTNPVRCGLDLAIDDAEKVAREILRLVDLAKNSTD